MNLLHYTMNSNQEKKIGKTVAHYDKLSKNYDRTYSAYLEHTHHRLLNHISPLPGDKILDISCGTGLLAGQLLNKHSDIELVLNDPSEGMIALAKERLKAHESVQFTNQTAEAVQSENQLYDSVICLNSFHYYADQKRVIQNIFSVLKPSGISYLLDWNRQGWFHLPNAIISLLSPEHINTRSLPEVQNLLTEAGFNIRYNDEWAFRFWKFYLVEAVKDS